MLIAPDDVMVACPFSTAILVSSSGDKFQCAVAFFIPKSEMVAASCSLACFGHNVFSFWFYKICKDKD